MARREEKEREERKEEEPEGIEKSSTKGEKQKTVQW